jgi:hypothetical protein
MIRTALLFTGLLACTPAAHAQDFTFAEVYDVAGTSFDGSPYEGTLTVDIVSDTTYTVEWTIGATVLNGFGMRMNDTLSAAYTLADGTPGLVMYEVGDDGVLEGIWTIPGESGVGTETLTPRE